MKSSKPSAIGNLKRFEQVITGLRSFSEREKGIERARSIKDSNRRQSLEEQKQLLRREHAAAVKLREQEAALEIENLGAVMSARKLKIDQAQIAVRNEVISSIQATEGQQKAIVQRRFMEAGKKREASLAKAAERFEEESSVSNELSGRGVATEKLAIRSVRGYQAARNRFVEAIKVTSAETHGDTVDAESLTAQGDQIVAEVRSFRSHGLVKLFNVLPLVIQIFLLLLIGGVIPFLSTELGGPAISYFVTLPLVIVFSLGLFVLFLKARSRAVSFASSLAEPLANWKQGRLAFKEQVVAAFEKAKEEAEADFAREKKAFDSGLVSKRTGGSDTSRYAGPDDVEARATSLKAKLTALELSRIESIKAGLGKDLADGEEDLKLRLAAVANEQTEAEMIADLDRQFDSLISQWNESVPPLHGALRKDEADELAWLESGPENWSTPVELEGSIQFGVLNYDSEAEELAVPKSEKLRLAGPVKYHVPLRLRIPDAASLFVETKKAGRDEALAFLNFLTLGWLASAPPGRLSFSFFDPVGLGESFAGLMHLADYDEILINSRIRTRENQIETRLGELCEHMEKVIQMYLRNDYETITEYNEAAGTIAERYHFVVVADFPNGFSDLAIQRLQSIASSGARCGVFLLMHVDQRVEMPRTVQKDDLQRGAVCLRHTDEHFVLKDLEVKGAELVLPSPPPSPEFAAWVHRIGESNRDSNRIEVPFSFIAPKPDQRWTGDATKELAVPIGRSGATKLQLLALGKGTCQHGLIAGKTGSGKSTLFHVIVTNLALWCDPDEVEFYLIDFKKGVEFKCYADRKLPHARVIAIESDREFGLSVLQRLDQELRERGELFRAAGVQDVPGYRALEGAKKLPRTLLLIDEFQEFFIEEDQISQQAAVLLDRIVRQGRAFGIHAVLGSQTLGGAFTLARATLGQMTVRIALACNEADAYLIMDDSNPAPRLLTRPGEGIYNDSAGSVEANSPFQVVWMEEQERNRHLDEIRDLAENSGKVGGDLVVFEGNAPGDVTQDRFVSRVLSGGPSGDPRMFLGSPNAIKDSTAVSFSRQSGGNLLFVGPREDVMEAILPIGLATLRAQIGESGRLILFDPRLSEHGPYAERVRMVEGVETPSVKELDGVLVELAAELKRISDEGSLDGSAPTFLFIPSLQRHKKLRYEEDFSFSMEDDEETKPAKLLNDLICEGPGWGFHVVTSLDSLNNVNRCLGRKAVGEFEKKVLFQMSATDSASLIDSGAAAGLGLSRAVFYDEAEGNAEIFRPYAEAPPGWFAENNGALIRK